MKRIISLIAAALIVIAAPPAFAGSLCSLQMAAPITGATTTAIAGFGAPAGVELDARFSYGSGGTATDVWVETSTDGGTTWFDVANFHFTTMSANSYQNVTGSTAVNSSVAMTNMTLAANTSINGLIGDRYRCGVTSTGTYSATSLTVNINPRY